MPTLTADEVRDLSPNALYVEAAPGIQRDVAILTELIPHHGFVGFIGNSDELLSRIDQNKSKIRFDAGRFLYSEDSERVAEQDPVIPHFVTLNPTEAVELVESFASKGTKIKIVVEDYNELSGTDEYHKLEEALSVGSNVLMPFGQFDDVEPSAMMTVDESSGKVSSTKGFKDVVSNIFSPMIATLSNRNWQASAKKAVADSGTDLATSGKEKVTEINKTVKTLLTKTKEQAETIKDKAQDTKESVQNAVSDDSSTDQDGPDDNDDTSGNSKGDSRSRDTSDSATTEKSNAEEKSTEVNEPTGTGIYDNGSASTTENAGTAPGASEDHTDSNYEPETVKFVSAEDTKDSSGGLVTPTVDEVESVTVEDSALDSTIPTPVDVANTFESSTIRVKEDRF